MKIAVLVLLLVALRVFGEERSDGLPADTVSVRMFPGDTAIALPHGLIQQSSFQLFLDSVKLPASAYSVNLVAGAIQILDSSLIPRDSAHILRLRAIYEYVPLKLQQNYSHRQLEIQEDTSGVKKFSVRTKSPPISIDNIFGPGFQKSGTLIRGVTAGNLQDVTLNSGFQLQFSGKVGGDVDITGSLTDNNTPIQPEGNTQTLQELDKVFITIHAPNVGGTLGDFVTTVTGTDLANVSRKVEGGEAAAHTDNLDARIIGATTRGKFRTMPFQGIDGVQGPYILTGDNGENGIIVVAGTEHVFVDGVEQTRGENLDYIIDYSTAEITFSSRRLITAASRITVDYEFSDHTYARSLLGAQASAHNADSTIRFTATFLREADNQDAPLDITISDSDRAVLSQAGADRSKASRSGIVDAGVDSISKRGLGLYVRRDTIINNILDTFYLYLPGDSLARYNVTFTYVGAGNGSYTRLAGQQYIFAGAGGGDYVPVVFLSMPTLTQILDGRLSATIVPGVTTSAEFTVSDASLNRFSNLPGTNINGTAGTLSLAVAPQHLGNAGTLDAAFRLRSLAPTFTPIDRIDDIEFAREWNLPANATFVKQNIIEGKTTYAPLEKTRVILDVGEIQVGDFFSTLRQQYTFSSSSIDKLVLDYHFENLNSTGESAVSSSRWLRNVGDARYVFGIFTPGFHIEAEDRHDFAHAIDSTGNGPDTLSPLSFKYLQFGPRLNIAAMKGLSLFGEYVSRTDDSAFVNTLQQQSSSTTARAGFDMQNLGGITSSGEFSVRNIKVDPLFGSGAANSQSVLFRVQGSARPAHGAITADVLYSAATERAAKLERVFVLVPYGTGQYIYLGDLNNNGVQDENEFSLTNANNGTYTLIYRPTDELYPIIDLKTSARVRLRPAAAFGATPSGLEKVLSIFSSETSMRVEERSTTPDISDIYLLRLSQFLNNQYTLAGTQLFQQDVFLWENSQEFSLRGRYSQRKTLSELATTGEAAYQREQSLRLRWHLVSELTSEFTGATLNDDLSSTGPSVNTPRQLGTQQFTSDLSYRPLPEIEIGWKVDVRSTVDNFVVPAVTAAKNFQTVRVAYAFTGLGRVQGEIERDNVSLGALPSGYVSSFQLTDGFTAGQTYVARAIFEYRVTANVQASANYTGRLRDGAIPAHTFQAEIRAMF